MDGWMGKQMGRWVAGKEVGRENKSTGGPERSEVGLLQGAMPVGTR